MRGFLTLLAAVVCSFQAGAAAAQRVSQAIGESGRVALAGTIDPRAAAQFDTGPVAAGMKINGMTMVFAPTAEQQADLDALVKAQQTPGSAEYHQWLTPAEYGSRFGLSDSDLAKVEAWLEQQGFSVDRVANSRDSITFSGTAEQVQAAFQTEIHQFRIGGETHFANAAAIKVPAALSGVVRTVRNLNDFRPKPFVRFRPQTAEEAGPGFTSSQGGSHYLTPKDVATIYDINAAYNSGYTGTGQTIAIMGQSAVELSDIENFQSAAGLTVKAPTMVLVPGSGGSAVVSGDEAESDLDLEYSGGIAKGATIDFVYTGNNPNYGVFDSIQYAVDEDIAPIISVSYGDCETDLGSSNYAALNAILEQGASQGQTIVAASGDDGSTACYGIKGMTTTEQEALAVNFPASSQYATGLGGTEFPAADVASTNTTYWDSASGSDVISSALSYIPEGAWNDDSSSLGAMYALSAGGGGASGLTARPSWQTGAGIPSGNARLVPDISLDSSADRAGYLYCSSDTSGWSSEQKASCNSSFRDASSQDLTVAGGTSFAAPIFAGMMAILNQKQNATGQGVVNATLYTMAANAATYASAFHDITSGSIACSAGPSYCSAAGESGFSAGTGYDEATGLGSIDLYNLLMAWPSGSSTGSGSGSGSFALQATNVTVAAGSSGSSTVTVTPSGGFTGAVNLACAVTASPSGATDVPTCSVSSSSVSITGTGGVTAQVTLATTAATAALQEPLRRYVFPAGGIAALAVVFLWGIPSRRRGWRAMLGMLILVICLAPMGCGSSGSGATSKSTGGTGSGTTTGTTAGSYTVKVTGTAASDSSLTASTTFMLTVN
ncbi:S53 family peptidase [Paracidobacterium acidisoli]|uniref:Peptidase S53 n=1 Tax=Paracidobacterium acidisoli TaxID=2303751 RepID=A0A372IP10_9BACT|nr:S53 family peptidase [Paracidobacterium acidisoli]MBT9330987.1 S53 family peptidase [Paracidobacterium acidisoli]